MQNKILATWSKSSLFSFILFFNYLTEGQINHKADIVVHNWPIGDLFADKDKPEHWIGNDPVLGRLICPPITRLNLEKDESQGIVIRDVEISKEKNSVTWKIHLRTGLHWWDGSLVTEEQIATFLKYFFNERLHKKLFIEKIPKHDITIEQNTLKVIWDGSISFGPYVLNGEPFWHHSKWDINKSPKLDYQCIGLFKPIDFSIHSYLHVNSNEGYGIANKEILFRWNKPEKKDTASVHIHFKMAEDISNDPQIRPPVQAAACQKLIELPLMSIIKWNTDIQPTASSSFRKAMTTLTPRGTLLRSGAGFWGSLPSSLIPRDHPGYENSVLVRPFDLEDGAIQLEKLGYKRTKGNSYRTYPNGKTDLRLELYTNSRHFGLLSKVITDVFMSVGIDVHLTKNPNSPKTIHGFIQGIFLPWPEMDFSEDYDSRLSGRVIFQEKNMQDQLDESLRKYSLTLSEKQPDFGLLNNIHKKLFDSEPNTVIMQHFACIDQSTGISLNSLKQINTLNPDWFKQLIL